MEKKAVIIGGSLSGLMHGIMLKNNGYSVTILEQEASSMRSGFDAGINAGPYCVQFLRKYDHVNRPYAVDTPVVQIIKRNEAQAWKMARHMSLTSWGLLMSIMRANFDGAPSKAIPGSSKVEGGHGSAIYRNGARVMGVKDADDKVSVQYDDLLNQGSQTVLADLVVAADGSNSSIRKALVPEVSRKYAGYVSWRGTVREDLLEERHRKMLQGKAVFHRMNPGQMLCYIIPTDDGDLEPGNRLFNWVWYVMHPEGSTDLQDIMTDVNGTTHYGTVPRELIRPEVWEKQRNIGMSILPACLASLVEHTEAPFVTKIHNVASTKGVFFGGKLLLTGDALAGFRPHPGESTNQAAYHCQLLEGVIQGKITTGQWERAALRFAHKTELWSIVLGSFGLGLKFALLRSLCKYILLLARQALGFVY